MSKVTAKLQITVPKALAERFGLQPGDEIEWRATGDALHIIPPAAQRRPLDRDQRLALFDEATRRQRSRESDHAVAAPAERGWARDDLYARSRPR